MAKMELEMRWTRVVNKATRKLKTGCGDGAIALRVVGVAVVVGKAASLVTLPNFRRRGSVGDGKQKESKCWTFQEIIEGDWTPPAVLVGLARR